MIVLILHIFLFMTYKNHFPYSTTQLQNDRGISKSNGIKQISAVSGTRFRLIHTKKHTDLQSNLDMAIPKPLLQLYTTQCRNWVVVTSIFKMSQSIQDIIANTNWCLVIIADKKSKHNTPEEYFQSVYAKFDTQKHFFLSVSEQMIFYKHFSVMKQIPYNHFGRKNIGYLFAIRHNAQFIFDMDDDNKVKPGLLPNSIPKLCVSAQDSGIINPYPYFGQSYTWPRGLPLTHAKNTTSVAKFIMYNEQACKNIGIVQSLADHDADVDAILRLTSHHYPMTFKKRPFVLEIPRGNFAPFNAQATLFAQSSFWALLLPISVHGRVSDIWRSFIAQTLLKLTGDTLAFSSPWVDQIRTSHDILADFDSEIPLYVQSLELVNYLRNWTCSADKLETCIEQLYNDLYDLSILHEADIFLVRSWIMDLRNIGYKFPRISTTAKRETVSFYDTLPTVFTNSSNVPISEKILGIVVLNYDNILQKVRIEEILSKFFVHPHHCHNQNRSYSVQYDVVISAPKVCHTCHFKPLTNTWSNRGFLAYNSIIQANYVLPGYKGYLNIHDDFAINYCAVGSRYWDQNTAWFSIPYPTEGQAQLSWDWWSSPVSQIKLGNFSRNKKQRNTNLQQVRKVTSQVAVNMIADFNVTLHLNKLYSKSSRHVYAGKGQSDAFFVGADLIADFNTALYSFAIEGVFLETAVPHTAKLTIPPASFRHLPLCTAWDSSRRDIASWLLQTCTTAHPIKLSTAKNILLTRKFSTGTLPI